MIKRIIVIAIILLAVAAAGLLFSPARFFAASSTTVEEVTIAPRSISFGIEATGTLRAMSVQNFGGPAGFGNYWQWQIVSMIAEGKNVKKGDILLNFDTQKINMDLMQFQNELQQATKELEKTRVQIDLEDADLRAKLATAENKFQTSKLKEDTTNAQIVTAASIEDDRLVLEQARQEVAALKEQIDWHKKSSEATYQIIASKTARAQNKVNEIKSRMENFQAKADREGVAVYKQKWNGDRFQVGETVWSGQPIIEIPDLNTIVAEAFIPEVDIGKVKTGLRAEITIDAFPGKSYTGQVKSIGTLVHAKSWDIPNQIMETQIALDHLDIAIMRPSMGIRVKVETGSQSDILAVPLKAVHPTSEGGVVKLKTDAGWREQKVKIGESNGTDVIIVEGLKPGDHIAADYKAK